MSLAFVQFVFARLLSVEDFGVYSFVISLNLVMIAIVVWGLDKYTIQSIALNVGCGHGVQSEYFVSIIKMILFNATVSAPFCMGIVYYGLHDNFNYFIGLSSLLLLIAGSYALIASSITKGIGKVIVSEFYYNFIRPLVVSLSAIFIFIYFDELKAVHALIFMIVAYLIVILVLTFKNINHLNKFDHKEYVNNKSLYRKGFPFFVMGLGLTYLSNIDILFVGLFLGVNSVAVYSLASKLVGMVLMGLVSANMLIMPKIASLYKHKKIIEMKKKVKVNNIFIGIITVPVLLVISFFGEPILIYIKPDYSDAKSVVDILLIGQVVNVLAGPVVIICAMAGQQVVAAKIMFVICVMQTLLCFSLIPSYGIHGAAYANISANILLNLSLLVVVFRKVKIDPSFFTFFRKL